MSTDQFTGVLQYSRPKSIVTENQSLVSEYRTVTTNTENQMVVRQYISLDSDAISQEYTITITAGVDGDIYEIQVDDDTINNYYAYVQHGTMTAAAIATELARRIDLHPSVRAVSSGAVITVKGVMAGLTFALDNSDSTDPLKVVINETAVASGEIAHRLISETKVNWTTELSGIPKTNYQTTYYNGAATPVVFSNGPLFESKGTLSLDSIQTSNGIPRP